MNYTLQKFDKVLLEDPEDLFKQVEQLAQQASRTNHRCTPQKAGANRDFKTKEINGIAAGGLFTISLYKVAGTIAPPPAAEPPAPDDEPAGSDLPRQLICTSRDDDTPAKFMYLKQFPHPIQALLLKGNVWRFYLNMLGQVIAEVFGGNTHPVL